MVKVTFRLIGGEEDKLFERIDLDPETHVDDLIRKINSVTQIPDDFQNIVLHGERLPQSEYPLQNIRYGDELLLSHNLLENWETYVKMIEEIQKMTSSGVTSLRREIALKAHIQLSPLFSSNFFVVYPNFAMDELNISKNLNFLVHNTKKNLERSVLAYFEALFPHQKVELKGKSEDFAGIHPGVFVFVDNEASFYAKTLGSIPGAYEEIDVNRPIIDLMEIYIYALLKLIGLGPSEVHVIPDLNDSESVFIATKLIDRFRTASGVSIANILETPSTQETEKVVIDSEMKRQMHILASLLCLSDLQRNKGNHGVVEIQSCGVKKEERDSSRHELRIVDFGVNIRTIDNEPNIFNSSADQPFLKMYFEKWNFFENIYRAKEEMEANPALKDNKNVNQNTFDRFFKRLEIALKKFLKD